MHTWAITGFSKVTDSPSRELMARILSYSFSWNVTVFTLSNTPSRWAWIVWESLAWPKISSKAGSDTKKKRGNTRRFFSRYLWRTLIKNIYHQRFVHKVKLQSPGYRRQGISKELLSKHSSQANIINMPLKLLWVLDVCWQIFVEGLEQFRIESKCKNAHSKYSVVW